MKIKRIVCCCGAGMGSSMLLMINVEEVLEELGYKDVEVFHSTISDLVNQDADIYVFSMDLIRNIKWDDKHMIVLNNIMDTEELKSKLKPKFE